MGKKYKVIVKVGNDTFLKYNVTSLSSFVRFLNSNHSTWRWFNYFDYKSGVQVGSYTNYK